jgi:toxin ParE1/3/4
MSSFKLTVKAKQDLRKIAIHTEKRWGKKQRNIYIKQFDDIFHILASSPQTGKTCDYIKEGYRKFPQSSHIVFYRIINDELIEIVRILHKKMDYSLHFQA